jgi:hypothetical protein
MDVVAKFVPGIGLIFGLGFGMYRLIKCQPGKALLEVLSGISSCAPGIGTGIAIDIDGGLIVHDTYEAI